MTKEKYWRLLFLLVLLTVLASTVYSQGRFEVRTAYTKTESLVRMRDGVKLYTIIYAPRDTSRKYPILLNRTPYGISPYGKDVYRTSLGPNAAFAREGYIFVYQDVRGKHMSEGQFDDVRPFNPNKKSPAEIDEASDTYDTIDWLLKNVPGNSGKVGMWGISYPGFYVSMGLLSGHPALVAASPQAPIADWFIGDDDHHNGALFLMDAFGFNAELGWPRKGPTTMEYKEFNYGTDDGTQFFLGWGSVATAQTRYFRHQIEYWNNLTSHPNYDAFWQARSVLPHLRNIKPAVMVVGGWFDAEDLYGALQTFGTIDRGNPASGSFLVMGPWCHGCWESNRAVGPFDPASSTGAFFRESLELPFFNHYLKGKGPAPASRASIYFTGVNEWRQFNQWPPANTSDSELYLRQGGRLSFEPPADSEAFDEYLSDPQNPVPYTASVTTDRGVSFMAEDQRFLSKRSDVISFQTGPLANGVTMAGPLKANLVVSTSGSDSDFIVKLIDVFPSSSGDAVGGQQVLIRWEVMRGRYRNSFQNPEAFESGRPTNLSIKINDVAHTFAPGHRIMVQIQSSMFPLIDRNPQTFVDIYNAEPKDFRAARNRVYHNRGQVSSIRFGRLKP